jgi:hypothetical protein
VVTPVTLTSISYPQLDTIVALWLGGRVREWAEVAASARDVGEARDRLAKRLDELRVDEERLATGRTVAAHPVARGDMTERDFLAAKREADRELVGITDEAAAVRAELDALEPGRDVYERLARDSAGLTPEAWAVQLRRLVRELRVGRDTVTLVPWHGEPVVHDRTALQPSGAHQRGPNGRFVLGSPLEPEWPEGLVLVVSED